MPQFSFLAKSVDGKEQKGTREADDQIALAHSLRQEGFVLIKAEEKGVSKKSININLPMLGVGLKEKIFFCKNLQVMAASGLSLPRAIGILADQATHPGFQKALSGIREKIIKGENFSSALAKYPNIFSEFLQSMVKVGEETGTLEHVLGIAVQQMEKEYSLNAKVKGALVYPAVVLTAMIGIGILMLATVVPELAATFEELKIELPVTTQFVIGMGEFVKNSWGLLIIMIIAVVAGFIQILKTRWGKKTFDKTVLKFPAISGIVRNINSAYTLRNLSALIGAGVSLPRALQITAGTLGNTNYQAALLDVEARVKKGEKFSAAIAAYSHLYPATAVQMIAVGEETGETSNILIKLAEFYENEVDEATKNFASIIEPMLMIVMGVAVGFFAVSMIEPMYSMMDAI